MVDLKSLLGGTGIDAAAQIAVERAIAEFRAGRPVLIEDADESALAAPMEGLSSASVAALEGFTREGLGGCARLALSGARLSGLGAASRAPGALALDRIDLARIANLALGRAAKLDAPVLPPTPAENAALHLSHLAGLLPAVVTLAFEKNAFADAPILRAGVEAILSYKAAKAAGLHIVSRAPAPLEGAQDCEIVVFRGGEGLRDHAAVVIGRPDLSQPVPVRLHSACLTGDLLGSLKCDCGDQLRMTAREMGEGAGGIILYLDQEGRGNGLACKIKAYALQAEGYDTYEADELLGFDHDQRRFDFAAEMLKQLGVRAVRLLTNNPVKSAALVRAGIEVTALEAVHGRATVENLGYLEAKRDKAGHRFSPQIALKTRQD